MWTRVARSHRPHRSLNAGAPLKPLPEPIDLEHYGARRQARVDGLINEYRLVACRGQLSGTRRWLDDAFFQSQASQVGAAAVSALVADAVQVGADGAHADEELAGDLGIGPPLGDQGYQLAFS